MIENNNVTKIDNIHQKIHSIRGQRVMLDFDLANFIRD